MNPVTAHQPRARVSIAVLEEISAITVARKKGDELLEGRFEEVRQLDGTRQG